MVIQKQNGAVEILDSDSDFQLVHELPSPKFGTDWVLKWNLLPTWSDDGKHLHVSQIVDEDCSFEVVKFDLETKGVRSSLFKSKKFNPTISPNEKWIAFWAEATSFVVQNLVYAALAHDSQAR